MTFHFCSVADKSKPPTQGAKNSVSGPMIARPRPPACPGAGLGWGQHTLTDPGLLTPAGQVLSPVKPWVKRFQLGSGDQQAGPKRGKRKRKRNPPRTGWEWVGMSHKAEQNGLLCAALLCSAPHLFCVCPRRCIRPCPHLHSGVFGPSLADAGLQQPTQRPTLFHSPKTIQGVFLGCLVHAPQGALG